MIIKYVKFPSFMSHKSLIYKPTVNLILINKSKKSNCNTMLKYDKELRREFECNLSKEKTVLL